MKQEKVFLIPFGHEVLALTMEEYTKAQERAVQEGFASKEPEREPEVVGSLLSVEQGAELLNVSASLLYGYVRKKKIPFIKIGAC